MVSCVGTVFFIWCVIGIEFDEGQLLGEMNEWSSAYTHTHTHPHTHTHGTFSVEEGE